MEIRRACGGQVDSSTGYDPRSIEGVCLEGLKNESNDPWMKWRWPQIRCVEVVRQHETSVTPDQEMGFSELEEKVASEWKDIEYNIHGREWNWFHDDTPYNLHNMTRDLPTADVKWK